VEGSLPVMPAACDISSENPIMGVPEGAAGMDKLRALAMKSLESSGVLSQIRAQLRASVYRALEQDGNDRAWQLGEVPGTTLSTEMIAEFLEFHGLQHSLSVFRTEAKLRGTRRARSELAAEAGLGTVAGKYSVLEQLISNYCKRRSEQKSDRAIATDKSERRDRPDDGRPRHQVQTAHKGSRVEMAFVGDVVPSHESQTQSSLNVDGDGSSPELAPLTLSSRNSTEIELISQREYSANRRAPETDDAVVMQEADLQGSEPTAGVSSFKCQQQLELEVQIGGTVEHGSEEMSQSILAPDAPHPMGLSVREKLQDVADKSMASLFDSTVSLDASVDSMEIEKCDYFEKVDMR